MTKVKIELVTELNLAKFTLYLSETSKVDLPQISGEYSIDLVTGTYDIAVASKGNEEGKKAKFIFSSGESTVRKSVRAGKSGKAAGFVQFTLKADGGLEA